MSVKAGLFWLLFVIVLIAAWKKDHHRKKDFDTVTIEGKTFPIVVDEYDNWYIKQSIDSTHVIYIPANFETTYEDDDN